MKDFPIFMCILVAVATKKSTKEGQISKFDVHISKFKLLEKKKIDNLS